MNLTLQAISLNERPLTQPIVVRFDEQGGTVGREDRNTMALPDPERHVSRVQAEVVQRHGAFAIRNVSATNPIMVAGRLVAPGEVAPLAHGEQIRVGGYLLVVRCEPEAGTESTRILLPPAPPETTAALVLPPRAIGGAAAAENPFADLLDNGGGAAAEPPAASPPVAEAGNPFGDLLSPPAGVHADSAAFTPAAAPPRLPADFDPFAPPRPAAPRAAGSFAGLETEPAPRSIDADFDLGTPAAVDALARFTAETGGPTAPAAPTQADNVPAIEEAFTPPQPIRPPGPATAPARPLPPAAMDAVMEPQARPTAGTAPAWQAFCEGAGIDLPLAPGDVPERLRLAGRLLNSAIAGVLQLVAVRASTKYEMRADVTMIQQRGNNPLKFAPDARAAVEQLMQPPARGFLEGRAAMDDVMHDLVGHSIGTVAGMRAAIDGMLERFDPAALEAREPSTSALDRWWPMRRRARLWESYRQHHLALREQAREDFHALFGRAFLAAYEQQVERLERQSKSP